MPVTQPDVFEQTLQKTNEWLTRLATELAGDDRQLAYRALRASLHALRDRLIVDEAAHLGAQLPLLVRGIYYEEPCLRCSGRPIRRSPSGPQRPRRAGSDDPRVMQHVLLAVVLSRPRASAPDGRRVPARAPPRLEQLVAPESGSISSAR
jgi:uncharacterized protein (DUF2267 family)